MGITVIAYSGLSKADPENSESSEGAQVRPSVSGYFPGRAREIEAGQAYHYARRLAFRAGTPQNYCHFRDQLALLAGYEDRQQVRESIGGPFHELLYFSDSEGTLGTAVCEKLDADFQAYLAQAAGHPSKRFQALYRAFMRVFALARSAGIVTFQPTAHTAPVAESDYLSLPC